ncbi:ankyrin protein, partial [Xylogone sp. PMI_703]
PLHFMARKGDLDSVGRLLEMGSNPNTKANYSGNTPLFEATSKGSAEVIECLLQHGASITERGAFKKTILHAAASKGHLECVLMLTENNADVESKGKDGYTPLGKSVYGC